MDTHYNWSDPEFVDECGESLNLAIDTVADVLHTLCTEAHQEQRGDLDSDGQITVVDAVIALQIVVSGEYDGDTADMIRGGIATSLDALMTMPSEAHSKSCGHSQKIERVIPMRNVTYL